MSKKFVFTCELVRTMSTIGKDDVDRSHFAQWIDYEEITSQMLYTEFSRFYLQEQRDARILQSCIQQNLAIRIRSGTLEIKDIERYPYEEVLA